MADRVKAKEKAKARITGEMSEVIQELHGASDKHKKQALRLTKLKESM